LRVVMAVAVAVECAVAQQYYGVSCGSLHVARREPYLLDPDAALLVYTALLSR